MWRWRGVPVSGSGGGEWQAGVDGAMEGTAAPAGECSGLR